MPAQASAAESTQLCGIAFNRNLRPCLFDLLEHYPLRIGNWVEGFLGQRYLHRQADFSEISQGFLQQEMAVGFFADATLVLLPPSLFDTDERLVAQMRGVDLALFFFIDGPSDTYTFSTYQGGNLVRERFFSSSNPDFNELEDEGEPFAEELLPSFNPLNLVSLVLRRDLEKGIRPDHPFTVFELELPAEAEATE